MQNQPAHAPMSVCWLVLDTRHSSPAAHNRPVHASMSVHELTFDTPRRRLPALLLPHSAAKNYPAHGLVFHTACYHRSAHALLSVCRLVPLETQDEGRDAQERCPEGVGELVAHAQGKQLVVEHAVEVAVPHREQQRVLGARFRRPLLPPCDVPRLPATMALQCPRTTACRPLPPPPTHARRSVCNSVFVARCRCPLHHCPPTPTALQCPMLCHQARMLARAHNFAFDGRCHCLRCPCDRRPPMPPRCHPPMPCAAPPATHARGSAAYAFDTHRRPLRRPCVGALPTCCASPCRCLLHMLTGAHAILLSSPPASPPNPTLPPPNASCCTPGHARSQERTTLLLMPAAAAPCHAPTTATPCTATFQSSHALQHATPCHTTAHTHLRELTVSVLTPTAAALCDGLVLPPSNAAAPLPSDASRCAALLPAHAHTHFALNPCYVSCRRPLMPPCCCPPTHHPMPCRAATLPTHAHGNARFNAPRCIAACAVLLRRPVLRFVACCPAPPPPAGLVLMSSNVIPVKAPCRCAAPPVHAHRSVHGLGFVACHCPAPPHAGFDAHCRRHLARVSMPGAVTACARSHEHAQACS
ncbi:hypothetical protein GGX14DRAFT_573178 [Mycena pura]|uniref:Uncharacterized protein n=1 Tax=Mycena pura TaxID=153505 RepID=A0AAD6Y655_9AGAR|nr:hypothetical protein GGX14DRAFT_573178 [Mycena pura]